jgi:hypothetical protein
MMKLMVEMPYGQAFFVLYQERLKTGMPKHRPQGQRIQMKNNMHRMHRNPGKRPCGNIPVVQRMHPVIQKLDM